MANKAKHAFGELARVDEAIASGTLNAYDILFVQDENGKHYVGWISKDGEKIICDNSSEIADLKTELKTEFDAKIEEKVEEKVSEITSYEIIEF